VHLLEFSIFGVYDLYILPVCNCVFFASDVFVFHRIEKSNVKFGSTCSYPLIRFQVGSQLGYPFNQLPSWEHEKLVLLLEFAYYSSLRGQLFSICLA